LASLALALAAGQAPRREYYHVQGVVTGKKQRALCGWLPMA